jgi:type I restriction enzyme M protein
LAGFSKAAKLEEIRRHSHVLTPGRYVGAEDVEDDDVPFATKMTQLTVILREQQVISTKLDQVISLKQKELGYGS